MTVERHNYDRILQMFALFTAVGYLVYPFLLLPALGSQAALMPAWWTPVMAVAVFGSGILLLTALFIRDIGVVRAIAGTAAVVYLIAVATVLLCWDGTAIANDDALWLAGFPGLASLAAVLAWPAWAGFGYMVVACVSVQLVNFVMRDGAEPQMLGPDMAFAIMFCSLFVGGAMMALRTGRILDATTADTHITAAEAAAQRARVTERERFDGLIHDSVLATLNAGAGAQPHASVQEMATAALAELDEVRQEGVGSERAWGLEAALDFLVATAHAIDPDVDVQVRPTGQTPDDVVPAEVVRALAAAQSEALRNSLRHAGPSARRTLVLAVASPGTIDATVSDDGRGFDPADVSPRRLGISVSIRRRMARLSGGWAYVDSTPGDGTTVRMGWRAV
ncbi:MAG: ATP-binding protein [Gordonia sp. (in: high G+C Gram-positive bacteria)]|uniref:sensor histidine kinase n=1 Tax=Gordonia sp. (in: high G+C Gram-positive bacteria) TaxID=84139 RepID=UPI003BB6B246